MNEKGTHDGRRRGAKERYYLWQIRQTYRRVCWFGIVPFPDRDLLASSHRGSVMGECETAHESDVLRE